MRDCVHSCFLQTDPSFAHQALSQLPSVPRFTMVAAMLPKSDKALVSDILQQTQAAGLDTQALRKTYRV